jgi:hypothetical protein
MEEVPQEPITADPREDDEDDEDVPEEDVEHGVKLADSANELNSGKNDGKGDATPGRRRRAGRPSRPPRGNHGHSTRAR